MRFHPWLPSQPPHTLHSLQSPHWPWSDSSDGARYWGPTINLPSDFLKENTQRLQVLRALPGVLLGGIRNVSLFVLKLNCLLFPPVLLMSSMWQQAGGLSVLTRSWREGGRPVKQSEGREGRSGAVWCSCTWSKIYTCKHTHTHTTEAVHACALLCVQKCLHTWKWCAYNCFFPAGNTLTLIELIRCADGNCCM